MEIAGFAQDEAPEQNEDTETRMDAAHEIHDD
jgi:hypothetical protein